MSNQREWMDDQKFRRFWAIGWSLANIAHANEEATGFLPDPATVSRRAQRMGLPSRKPNHKGLIPWRIRPAHRSDPVHYALRAVSRERQNLRASKQDGYRARWLRDLLTHRGTPMVIDYDPVRGFIFLLATDADTDIIRHPDHDGTSDADAAGDAAGDAG